MPCVEFEPTIPKFQGEKTFRALDRAAVSCYTDPQLTLFIKKMIIK
jgi:hypothetical protein